MLFQKPILKDFRKTEKNHTICSLTYVCRCDSVRSDCAKSWSECAKTRFRGSYSKLVIQICFMKFFLIKLFLMKFFFVIGFGCVEHGGRIVSRYAVLYDQCRDRCFCIFVKEHVVPHAKAHDDVQIHLPVV